MRRRIGSFAGHACTNIGRLNVDGLRDANFNASANEVVYSVALQPNGTNHSDHGAFQSLGGVLNSASDYRRPPLP